LVAEITENRETHREGFLDAMRLPIPAALREAETHHTGGCGIRRCGKRLRHQTEKACSSDSMVARRVRAARVNWRTVLKRNEIKIWSFRNEKGFLSFAAEKA
jgi:hypothetical protein